MQQVFRRIRFAVLYFTVLISAFIFLAIYRPFTSELEKEVMNGYYNITYNKHHVLEEYVKATRNNAASLSSRTVIRDMLSDYLEGKVSFEELKEFTAPRYNDGTNIIEQLVSATRITIDGQVVYPIDGDEDLVKLIKLEEKELVSQYNSEEGFIFVQSPIKKGIDILGFDIIIVDTKSMIKGLGEGIYDIKILDESSPNEVLISDGRITSYINCDFLNGTISISADEAYIFDTVRSLTKSITFSYFIGIIIMFLITQFLIIHYVSKFMYTQEGLKDEAEKREKDINHLYEKLKDSEEIINVILDISGEGIWDWHMEEGMVYHNKRWCTILGLEDSYLSHKLDEFSSRLYPDDRDRIMKSINEAIETQGKYYSEHRMLHSDGSIIWVIDKGTVIKKPNGKVYRMIGSITDITQGKKAQLDLFLEKEIFQSTLLSVGDGIISTDVNGRITVINPVAEILTQWKQEAIGKNIDEVIKLIDPETKEPLDWRRTLGLKKQSTQALDNMALLVSRYGREMIIYENITSIYLPSGDIVGYVMVFKDMTELFEKQKKIEYMSFHDELTGLYNRRYMEDALRRLDTSRNLPFTIMTLDLNNLKSTNDIFGHEFGDLLIIKTAEFLREVFRRDDIISRIGGDEFCILMPKTSAKSAEIIKKRIQNEASLYQVNTLRLCIAVGYAVKTKDEEKIQDVLRDSDANMYKDKQYRRKDNNKKTMVDFLEKNYAKFISEKDHDYRVSILAGALYQAIGKPQEEVEKFQEAVKVHDIGKIIVPSQILNKEGALTKEEWEKIKKHPQIGYQIIKTLKEHEAYAQDIYYHHERVDGRGYPEGLIGEDIPLGARVIAIADAYEAMTARRPYKKSMGKEEAIKELEKNAGSQFDPKLLDVFLNKVLLETL